MSPVPPYPPSDPTQTIDELEKQLLATWKHERLFNRVSDATRIDRIIPTIREIARKGGKVILLSHFGRPKGPDVENSLKPLAEVVSKHLGAPV